MDVYTPEPLPIDQWSSIKIKSSIQPDLTYLYELFLNGNVYHTETNWHAQEFENLQVWASDPWHMEAPARIRNIKIETESAGNDSLS